MKAMLFVVVVGLNGPTVQSKLKINWGEKMGGSYPKLSYKNLKTIKHALQDYLNREGITENDLKSEQALLSKINNEIKIMREKHRF